MLQYVKQKSNTLNSFAIEKAIDDFRLMIILCALIPSVAQQKPFFLP